MLTFYGYTDNSPPSDDICCPSNEHQKDGTPWPTLHEKASGAGTFDDPITLASDTNEIPLGTKVYIPKFKKYFIMEDTCDQCIKDWEQRKKMHFDLWIGGDKGSSNETLSCEDDLTGDTTPENVILNAMEGYEVDTEPLFKNKQCLKSSHIYPNNFPDAPSGKGGNGGATMNVSTLLLALVL